MGFLCVCVNCNKPQNTCHACFFYFYFISKIYAFFYNTTVMKNWAETPMFHKPYSTFATQKGFPSYLQGSSLSFLNICYI